MNKSKETKFKTVIDKNTFYFYNRSFEEKYEGHLNSLKETLLILKHNIEVSGFKKELFESFLVEKENGLKALLILTGLSNETLKRLTTIIRIQDDNELNNLVYKSQWFQNENIENLREWTDSKIDKLIQSNEYFRKGIVNLLFEGSTVPFLAETIPLFELKKLSISKLKFEMSEMIDTLIRYKEKGSYSGKKENNPETLIENLLKNLNIEFEKGDLNDLISNFPESKRTMDFIIPNKQNPRIIIESSFLATTSSGQGDKSKTEISMVHLIQKYYPKAKFIGFIDGIGWYVRKEDLKRMVSAYEDVFTFHSDEIKRFETLVVEVFSKKEFRC